MGKNQIFKKQLSDDMINKILSAFGLRSLKDRRSFSRSDLSKLNSVEQIIALRPILQQYYLPCKARTYLNDLNEKNIITILRQCIKTRGYTIVSREKYFKSEKFIIYTICPLDQFDYISVISGVVDKKIKETIINFD